MMIPFLCAALTACGATGGGEEKADDHARAIYASVKRPESLPEMVGNIKLICDNALILRKDFYETERLLRFSGSDQAPAGADDNGVNSLYLSRFRQIMAHYVHDPADISYITWHLHTPSNKSGAWGALDLVLAFSDPSLRYEAVMTAWGADDWTPVTPTVYRRRPGLPPPPDEHALTAIRHGETRRAWRMTVEMEFNADGHLALLSCAAKKTS
jgi:hypothetical protein